MRTSSPDGGRERTASGDQKNISGSNGGSGRGYLAVIGLGPGDRDQMSLKAYRTLQEAEVIIGYKTYIDLVIDLVEGKDVMRSGMTHEVDRSRKAVDIALEGRKVAVVSSGDPGIYGMAGIILEIVREKGADEKIDVEIIPGITSATAAASTLGAPIMHDFAVISLSDLLTPWDVIEKRLHHAGDGDFITILYNPVSKKRTDQIKKAREILLQYKNPATPVGIVRNAKRGEEEKAILTLENFLTFPLDMFSVVIVGNRQTYSYKDLMITPRGYLL